MNEYDNDDKEIDNLEKILENEKNEGILDQSLSKINMKKEEVLKDLYLPKKINKEFLKKLKCYKYVDGLNEIEYGSYLRWINLKNINNLKLTNGGILCEIKIEEDPILILKNNMNFFFQINMNEALLFQKLSEQEQLILHIIEYVNK